MRFLWTALVAALLALAVGATPAAAQLTVRDATGSTQRLCEVTDSGGWFYPCHVMTGISAGAPKYLAAEADGSLDVTVKNGPGLTSAQLIAAGLALHTDAATGNASLAQLVSNTTGLALHSDTASTNTLLGGLLANTYGLALHSDFTAANAYLASLAAALNGAAVNTVVQGAAVDRGGSIVTGGVAQTFMAINSARRGWHLQNQSSGDLRVNCTATATLDYHSMLISAGQYYESSSIHVGTGACSIIGATTGQTFYAREF